MFSVCFFLESTLVHLDDIQNALRRFFFFSFFLFLSSFWSRFGLCRLLCDINLQDGVPVVEPPPLGFHHMFGNEKARVQVLENVCGQLVEGYGNEVGALGRNKL